MLYPVTAFFENLTWDKRNYEFALNALASGVGVGFEESSCYFADNRDEGEPLFDGIWFFFMKEQALISYVDFERILDRACADFVLKHPDSAEFTDACLAKIHERIGKLRMLSNER